MTRDNPHISRRTVLQTVAGTALCGVAGCLDGNTAPNDEQGSSDDAVFQQVAVDGTAVVVELSSDAAVDQINLVQPNGELFGQREVAAGSEQVSFEIGTFYDPGKYEIVALSGDQTLTEMPISIEPEIRIHEVGLYRNNPDKPWEEIYGETETDRLKNGEAFITVENTGNGPEAILELVFSGDVPNPIDNPRESGLYETEQVIIAPGETIDLFSSSFPFGSESAAGMGCAPNGNSGQFTVTVETKVSKSQISETFGVQYSGSNEMSDCEVTITEV